MKFLKRFIFSISCLLLVSCGEEAARSPTAHNHDAGKEQNQNCEIIQKPEYALSKDMQQMFIVQGQELPYFIFRMCISGKEQYITCKLDSKNKWNTEKAEWSDYIVGRHKNEGSFIVSDSKGTFYILCYNRQKTKYSLYRIMQGKKPQKLDIDGIYERQKDRKLLSFNLINDNRLIFFFSQDEMDIQGSAMEYDTMREEFIEGEGHIDDISANFDKNGNYYCVSPGQKLIMKKSPYHEIPEAVIKCDAITEESQNSLLIIQDDFGYILTRKGIYGGKIDDKNWREVLPVEQIQYCEDFSTPVLGIANIVKVSGEDREFYLMTWKNKECTDFEWIHYMVE